MDDMLAYYLLTRTPPTPQERTVTVRMTRKEGAMAAQHLRWMASMEKEYTGVAAYFLALADELEEGLKR